MTQGEIGRKGIAFWRMLLWITLVCGLSHCQKADINSPALTFMEGAAARAAIVQDGGEGFFEKVAPNDMLLQMGARDSFVNRDSLLVAYRQHLQNGVLDFSEKEERRIRRLMDEVRARCDELNPRIFPASIPFIKTSGNHYGPTAFYTRGNCIVVPAPMLEELSDKSLLHILAHEVFHVHSRLERRRIRKDLYALIRFERRGSPALPDRLAARLLLNPDGIDNEWYIHCPTPEGERWLCPLLVDKGGHESAYFARMELRFYVAEQDGRGGFSLRGEFYKTDELPALPDLIGDNTDYILHPDEILAENFVILLFNPTLRGDFSERGRALLLDMRDFYNDFW